jgi:hypothetical protein
MNNDMIVTIATGLVEGNTSVLDEIDLSAEEWALCVMAVALLSGKRYAVSSDNWDRVQRIRALAAENGWRVFQHDLDDHPLSEVLQTHTVVIEPSVTTNRQ